MRVYWLMRLRPYSPSLESRSSAGIVWLSSVDVRIHAERHDREPGEPAAGEEIEQVQQLVVLQQRLELCLVYAGKRHVGKEPEDDDHPHREEDLVAQIRRPDRVDERLEHAHVAIRGE